MYPKSLSMKNLFFTTLLLLFVFGSLKSQVYRYIPDSSFRNALKVDYACPFDLSGDSLDISSTIVTVSSIGFNLRFKHIRSIDGIQFFTSLIALDCSYNLIDSISELPPNLRSFQCIDNNLTALPPLPDSLESLVVNSNNLTLLPILPPNITTLGFGQNHISSLAVLPSMLYALYCNNNNLTALPSIIPSSLTVLNCNGNRISSLPPLPPNMYQLYCDSNDLTSLPTLPIVLQELYCSNNHLTLLPTLPTSLTKLYCDHNNLSVLPTLSDTLVELYCGYNNLTSLPTLSRSLGQLDCSHNYLTTIPPITPELWWIYCSFNRITILPRLNVYSYWSFAMSCDSNLLTSIPDLPVGCYQFNCNYNNLDSLPNLPNTLSGLSCSHNNLTFVRSWPSNIVGVDCSYNRLTELPPFSESTYYFICSHNNLNVLPSIPTSFIMGQLDVSYNTYLSCLPRLPNEMYSFRYDNTSISCIPNIPIRIDSCYPPILSMPLCIPFMDSCPSYVSIAGQIYQDANSDCILDTLENKLSGIRVMIQRIGADSFALSSNVNGMYNSDTLSFGFYVNHLDTLELPFVVSCPLSGNDSVLIDSSHFSDYNRNFALECKPGFDIGTIGLVCTTATRPASIVTFSVHAGDMAKLYGASCTSISGDIVLTYSGRIAYASAHAGSIIPDSILPNRLVWKIADFSTIDFFEDIKPNFYIDSSAVAGDLLCFTTEVTPTIGDRVPSNNSFSQCFTVRTSYDPNIKDVAPNGSVTASQGWMYYTIHFQNTGGSYAENIYVWDTIDASLDLNTIQVMGSSHHQFMQVYPSGRAVKFNFIHVNLLDSGTNEQASHGYVQYRIKLKAGLSEGLNIQNTASILFDLNTPVVTNTTSTIICNTPSQVTQYIIWGEGPTEVIVGLHHYSKTGIYTDILINSAGCDSVVKTIVDVFAGIDVVSPSRILFFPNPANTQVIIQLEGNSNVPLKVFDIYGRTVFSSDIMSNKYIVKTEFFQEGTYIIQCGNRHEKLVVKH